MSGTVTPGWEPVADAFRSNFESDRDIGASVAVYHRGLPVIDLVGGWFDEARTRPYGHDTLQLVFSTTKGLTAMAAAVCVERGWLDYDGVVAEYWPEFAAAGKEEVTVAQLLSHQAGLAAIDGAVRLEEIMDWDHMATRVAKQAPLWEPGSAHGYHALTFGWLAGELVHRADPQRRGLGAFVADEVAGPVGAEAFIGLPEHLEHRVSPVVLSALLADPGVAALARQMLGPETLLGRALTLNAAVPFGDPVWNTRAVHAAQIPAANGISTASSLARVYAACVGEVDGRRLLDPGTVARASATITPAGEPDRVLVVPTTFGMGFMTSGPFTPMLGPRSFGHAGAGGSLAFGDPEAEIGFAYAMNKMDLNLSGDARAHRLVKAVSRPGPARPP